MASSKKGKAAPAPGPAPAAVRAPAPTLTAVPDPIGGDDGLVQPQPAEAVALTTADRERLVLVLQRAGHFPRPVGKKGNRMLRTDTTHGAEFRDGLPEGYVERVVVNPDGKRGVLVGKGPWQPADGWRLVSETRSAIDERAEAVGGLRIELEAVVRPLLRGSKLPMPEAWDQVLADDLLDAVTVGDALAALDDGQHREASAVVELRRVVVPAVEAAATAPPLPQPSPAPMPDLGHEERETLGALRKGPLETNALDKRGSTKRARARLRSWLIEQCGNGSSKRGYWRLLPDGRAVLARMDAGE